MRQSDFSRRLQILLDEMGYSQKEFSILTGTTEAAICRYLKGTREPNANTLSAIADTTNVTPNWLLGYGPDEPIERMK